MNKKTATVKTMKDTFSIFSRLYSIPSIINAVAPPIITEIIIRITLIIISYFSTELPPNPKEQLTC